MNLTADNYYSRAADYHYCSVSQYKDFFGSYGRSGCEKAALAKITGKYEPPTTDAMMIGSYVDAHFEGPEAFEKFTAENPGIFKADGKPKAAFTRADKIIGRVEQDRVFMNYMGGQKQVIMTGDIEGIPFKIKMDSYLPGKAIVDLKVIESIRKAKWVRDSGPMDFIEYWGYDIQGAVYQEIVRQNTGKKLPFFIAAVTKDEDPDFEVIRVDQPVLDTALEGVRANVQRVAPLKRGEEAPMECGTCAYCRRTRVLTGPIWKHDIVFEIQ